MTTRYRVEYALKTHRRDQFIEWIKGLLAVPFVLYSQPTGVFDVGVTEMSEEAHRRYAEIMRDVETMLDDHIRLEQAVHPLPSKLKMLVPTIGSFFTRLPLEAAFKSQDRKRYISSRRYVSPSFNDVRLILNTAQLMAVTTYGSLQLATFDGDVTLYDDGESLEIDNPVIPRMLDLMRKNVKIGIVTAAGYTTSERYYSRLHGLLDAIATDETLTPAQRHNIVIMGGEANYLFEFDPTSEFLLSPVPRSRWLTPEMQAWSEDSINRLLDIAEAALRDCIKSMNLPATLMRKDRAVGIITTDPKVRIPRESLEETVLVVQKTLELSVRADHTSSAPAPGSSNNNNNKNGGGGGVNRVVPFCAFNGGRDVFVDIGDKSWGVSVCQKWFGGSSPADEGMIKGDQTLHVGDQFLSAGANDFKARSVGTTAWIANPAETVELLDELAGFMGKKIS
ncbi:IMP-specific 5-nucleotidase [Microdochium trichocladiopsis]|uniref:IMP-specific 5'-nucleotidase 1 n=1 Tax=Microdochium trichocladiopsis TaxID=1682393 RepID=A0A9P8Y6U2_9PEZI|nr:IMP-specific 5-nucleotidase [Microdochium trichocladiopsis]KAH7029443.1 IMP-specific 5-nucleotidase [Microdochium trichocladiopsis]